MFDYGFDVIWVCFGSLQLLPIIELCLCLILFFGLVYCLRFVILIDLGLWCLLCLNLFECVVGLLIWSCAMRVVGLGLLCDEFVLIAK